MIRAFRPRAAVVRCLSALAVVLLACPQVANAQERTDWTEIRKGMSALLNEGWQIQSMTYNQILRRESISTPMSPDGVALAATPAGLEYSFMLTRQGKWAVCVVMNPKPGETTSRCRGLN